MKMNNDVNMNIDMDTSMDMNNGIYRQTVQPIFKLASGANFGIILSPRVTALRHQLKQ
jgi:hypothetical protein